jgi:hypothetical protein|tara:strand:- start:466 stop:1509 length:1044 start_codon:yes stop_codon:yes gene_type:complete
MDFDNKKKKVSGNVNVVCGADLWQDLHELHHEFGINKSDILNNFIHYHYKTKDDFMKVLAPVIKTRLQRQIAELEKLEGKVDSIQPVPEQAKKVFVMHNHVEPKQEASKELDVGSINNPVSLERSAHKCEFTEQAVTMVQGEIDSWLHDTKTKGLAIRFKKHGKAYYTRAKNVAISNSTLRIRIGDTKLMTLDEARQKHAQHLHTIYVKGINPNKIVPKKSKAEKPVKEDKTPNIEEDSSELLDFANLKIYTIDDIHILGRLLGNINPLLSNCMTKFHNALSKEAHRQCLDMFRDGITIAELRQKSFKLHTQYRNDPVTVGYQMLVYRLAKAIYNFGTKEEKEAFNF